jgi:hypothetical protein
MSIEKSVRLTQPTAAQQHLGDVTVLDVRGRVGKAPPDELGYVRTIYEGLRDDYEVRNEDCGSSNPTRKSMAIFVSSVAILSLQL